MTKRKVTTKAPLGYIAIPVRIHKKDGSWVHMTEFVKRPKRGAKQKGVQS